jgi:hypothetical protein
MNNRFVACFGMHMAYTCYLHMITCIIQQTYPLPRRPPAIMISFRLACHITCKQDYKRAGRSHSLSENKQA